MIEGVGADGAKKIQTPRWTPPGFGGAKPRWAGVGSLTQRRSVVWSGENPTTARNGLLFQSLSTPAA
jgi:hypothetical protein